MEPADSGWRTIFGTSAVRIVGPLEGPITMAVRSIEASVLPDLRVSLRLNAVRGEAVELVTSHRIMDRNAGPFSFYFDEPSQGLTEVRTLTPQDAEWFTDFKLPGLTQEQLELVVMTYAQVERFVSQGAPSPRSKQEVERLELVLSSRGTRVIGLRYVVEPPLIIEGERPARLEVWRHGHEWRSRAPTGRLDEHRPVHPEMVPAVLAAIGQRRVITRAAAVLAARPPGSTIIGEDPLAGVVRRHMDPVLEGEIHILLQHSQQLPADDADISFLRRVMAGTELSLTRRVFEAFTRLSAVIYADQPDAESAESEWLLANSVESPWPQWWVERGLGTPTIPRQFQADLLRSRDFTVWSTANFLAGYTVYGHHRLVPEFMSAVESNSLSPFFMAGLAGHGFNSYGVGIVARFNEYIVALQVGYGGASAHEGTSQQVVAMVESWNKFVRDVEGLRRPRAVAAPQGARWLITFSDFRGYAGVYARVEESLSDEEPVGWELVVGRGPDDADVDRTPTEGASWPSELLLAKSLVNELRGAWQVAEAVIRDTGDEGSPPARTRPRSAL